MENKFKNKNILHFYEQNLLQIVDIYKYNFYENIYYKINKQMNK